MSQTIGGGGNALQLSIPTRADVNWDLVMQTALTTITTHTHDGLTLGAAITLAAASVTNAKLATMASTNANLIGTVKGNISGITSTPTDLALSVFASASTVALRDTGGGFVGVLTNSNANTGSVGELLGPILRVQTNATPLTTATTAPVGTTTSITLGPGDWDIHACVGFLPAATTSLTQLVAAVSLSAVALPAAATEGVPTGGTVRLTASMAAQVPGANPITYALAPYRVTVSVSSTLQLFLVAQASFTVSTLAAYGSMEARRIR